MKKSEPPEYRELGELIQKYRKDRKYSVEGLLFRLSQQVDPGSFDDDFPKMQTYYAYEEGRLRVPRHLLIHLGKLFAINDVERVSLTRQLLKLANYAPLQEYEDVVLRKLDSVHGIANETKTDVKLLLTDEKNRFEELKKLISTLNPTSAEIQPVGGAGIAVSLLQKTITPGLYLVIAGALLGFYLPKSDVLTMLYLLAGIVLVVLLEFAKIRNVSKRNKIKADSEEMHLQISSAEYLFLSLFILLNSPLLVSVFTGMDFYGFFTLEGISRNQALMYAMLVNLGVAIVATLIFYLLWHQQHKEGKYEKVDVVSSTLKIVIPPIAFAYAIGALFGQWTTAYFMIVMVPLAVALIAMIGFAHPKVRIDSFLARTLLGCCFGVAAFVLLAGFVVGILKLMGYILIPDVPYTFESLVWTRPFDPTTLGYNLNNYDSVYLSRHQAGLMWLLVLATTYLIFGVCMPVIFTIYRKQYKQQ